MKVKKFLFARLTEEDFDWLFRVGELHSLSPGAVLLGENEEVSALHVVLDGTLGVFREAAGDQELDRIGRGEVIGEVSFVDDRPSTATIKAVTTCRVLSIPRETLVIKLRGDDGFSSRFYRSVASFLAARFRTAVTRRQEPEPDADTKFNRRATRVLDHFDTRAEGTV